MKRDLDLARQLLLDIESRGADCSTSVLRSGPNHDLQERIRYHLRLLIDAQLLQEVDRTSSGVPCVRLTHEGHELLGIVPQRISLGGSEGDLPGSAGRTLADAHSDHIDQTCRDALPRAASLLLAPVAA